MPRRRAASDPDDHRCSPRDSVDALLGSWHEQRPDLDFSPVGVVARLARVRGHIDSELDGVFAAHGLTAANFGVLVTLARIGGDAGVSQRRLMDELGLTSGTISVRMDRLVEAGLVDRRPDPESRRNTRITLTPRGRELFERVVPAHLANEARMLSALTDGERDVLATLLRKLLVEFEGTRTPVGGARGLGLTVAPAHVAMAMRSSVGLPAVPALLVRAVRDGGPAAAAGIRPGDLLVAAGDRELRCVAALYAAIGDGERSLPMRLLRGTDEMRVVVDLPDKEELDGTRAASTGRSGRGEHAL